MIRKKLELFDQALSRLNNATFKTTQCDLSENQLTDDQFNQINVIAIKNEPAHIPQS